MSSANTMVLNEDNDIGADVSRRVTRIIDNPVAVGDRVSDFSDAHSPSLIDAEFENARKSNHQGDEARMTAQLVKAESMCDL